MEETERENERALTSCCCFSLCNATSCACLTSAIDLMRIRRSSFFSAGGGPTATTREHCLSTPLRAARSVFDLVLCACGSLDGCKKAMMTT